jgi:hypothetical protein
LHLASESNFYQFIADKFKWREALHYLELSGKIVGVHEVREMAAELVMVVNVQLYDGRLLDASVPLVARDMFAKHEKHTLDLSIGPRMLKHHTRTTHWGSTITPGIEILLHHRHRREVFWQSPPRIIGPPDVLDRVHHLAQACAATNATSIRCRQKWRYQCPLAIQCRLDSYLFRVYAPRAQ